MRLTTTRKPVVGEVRTFTTSRPGRPAGNYRVSAVVGSGYNDGTREWDYEAELIPPSPEEIKDRTEHATYVAALAASAIKGR